MIFISPYYVKMATPTHHHEHPISSIYNRDCDVTLSCRICRKRHVRSVDFNSGRGCRAAVTKSSLSGLTLAVLAFPLASTLTVIPVTNITVSSPVQGKKIPPWAFQLDELGNTSGQFNKSDKIRSLEEAEDYDHDYNKGGHSEGDNRHDGDLKLVRDLEDDHDHEDENINSSKNSTGDSKPWGRVIGSTLIVNLATLSGLVLVVVPAVHRGYLKFKGVKSMTQQNNAHVQGQGKLLDICIPAFAAGALMATAVFLIFPEGLFPQNHKAPFVHLIDQLSNISPVLSFMIPSAKIEAFQMIEGEHGLEGGHAHDDHRYLQEDHDHSDHSDEMMLGSSIDSNAYDTLSGHDGASESLAAAKFGIALLCGFLLPIILSIFFHHSDKTLSEDCGSAQGDDDACKSCKFDDVETAMTLTAEMEAEAGDSKPRSTIIQKISNDSIEEKCECERSKVVDNAKDQTDQPLVTKTFINYRLCTSILIGDAFHNFGDGIFIGASFLSCSLGTAMSIVVVTLLHEIAQELADFILITRYGGLSILKACVLNFLSGLSVTLGGVVVLAGSPSDEAVGVILAVAGGVYVNIAATETIPRLENFVKSRGDRVLMIISFVVGTVPIGLILLRHEHCG